ncbi:hypothetical protein [Kitasatospora sp. NPDC002040]|uniref:hypothetical protein n=1 Tax=Kitasatospora sp. NPDC002040 TaxID=3154661 RepID=UPI003327071E
MRATWTAVVLTATLGLATVTTTSVTVANAADTAAATTIRPLASIVPPLPDLPVKPPVDVPVKPPVDLPVKPPVDLPVKPPGADLPALPDPAKNLAVLGSLGDVLGQITKLVTSATSATPDPAALQKQLADLQAAVKSLLGMLPAAPVPDLPVKPPVGDTRIVPPLPVNPADALGQVQKAAADLVAKATATTPDPTGVKDAVPPLSTSTLTATVATATALATG